MRDTQRLACVTAALVGMTTSPALAAPSTLEVWGVLHVTLSLAGTCFIIWLLNRGVQKL